jgi:hypothetical protein
MYFKLSKENKKKVKRPIHPHDPYLKLTKNNKTFYKLRGELTKEDELLIPPPPPAPNASEEEIQKAKKAYKGWKKRTRNHIPSPPPPRNHLDQVIKMAKKGATFYFEKEPIDTDKAIALLKKNKKLNIHSESTNNSNHKVWISKKDLNTKIDTENVKYYLDNKLIDQEKLNTIPTEKIASVSVKKNKDGSKEIYIVRKQK